MNTILRVLVLILWPVIALGQSYPDFTSPYVNDFNNLLSQAVEDEITEQLLTLRETDGIEMTVVTIESVADYGGTTEVADFATALFNHWGVGDATKNNGVLMLISEADREVFIALGDGYGPEFDARMDQVFDQYMRDNFRSGDFDKGAKQGVSATIERLDPGFIPPEPPRRNVRDWLSDWGIFLGFGAMFAFFFGRRQRQHAKSRICPQCGQKSLERKEEFSDLKNDSPGNWRVRRITDLKCPACGFTDQKDELVDKREDRRPGRRSSSGGSFGGGSSSGGGGGGRW